jgi:hypothetical protein
MIVERGDDGCDDGDDSGIADAALVVLQVLPAMTVGGVERGVVEVAKHLRARRVRGLVASADGPLVAQLEGVPHICLGLLRSKNPPPPCDSRAPRLRDTRPFAHLGLERVAGLYLKSRLHSDFYVENLLGR